MSLYAEYPVLLIRVYNKLLVKHFRNCKLKIYQLRKSLPSMSTCKSAIAKACCQVYLASFSGLLSPNAVEGLVKLLRRMTSGRRWVYIWVDVGWTSGGVALPVKCSPRLDNYCQSKRSIRDRRSTTEQSVVTFWISRSRLTGALKTSETCGL